MSSAAIVRLSPVKTRRAGTPFVNFPSPPQSHVHLVPRARMWQDNATGNGWGIRHVADEAPFDLWSEDTHEFGLPSTEDKKWLLQSYSANAIGHFGNFLVLETAVPPDPLPLTIGGMPTMFVPMREPGELLHDPFSTHHNTLYASPRVEDPITSFKLPHWMDPSKEQMKMISFALSKLASVKRITYVWKFTIVELAVDGRTYDDRSLPGIVAGCTTLYHHSSDPYGGGMSRRRRWIVPDPGMDIEDVSNYLLLGDRQLGPGVRLSSSCYDIDGQPQTSMSTTSGVLLRNGSSVRMTCALHGWPNSNDVYHPQAPSGQIIGLIKERYDAQDIGLVDLHPSIRFTNSSYFDAIPPRRLLTSDDTRNARGSWYLADAMSTGCVAMMQAGIIDELPPRSSGHVMISYTQWEKEKSVYSKLYAMIGATGGAAEVADGLCGAPIVGESADSQGVGGFFQFEGGNYCIAPCLDQLVADGWSLF